MSDSSAVGFLIFLAMLKSRDISNSGERSWELKMFRAFGRVFEAVSTSAYHQWQFSGSGSSSARGTAWPMA
jgi:hypothetical protein